MEPSQSTVSNIWCGFAVSEEKKEVLTALTLAQFMLPVKDRVSTKKLLSLVGINIKTNHKTI